MYIYICQKWAKSLERRSCCLERLLGNNKLANGCGQIGGGGVNLHHESSHEAGKWVKRAAKTAAKQLAELPKQVWSPGCRV